MKLRLSVKHHTDSQYNDDKHVSVEAEWGQLRYSCLLAEGTADADEVRIIKNRVKRYASDLLAEIKDSLSKITSVVFTDDRKTIILPMLATSPLLRGLKLDVKGDTDSQTESLQSVLSVLSSFADEDGTIRLPPKMATAELKQD
jgi:hypothetical protein